MFGLGIWEIALVLVIGLLVLGPEKLPKVARKLGLGVKELKKAATEFQRSLNTEVANLEEEAKQGKQAAKELSPTGAIKKQLSDSVDEIKESTGLKEISELAAKAKRAKAELTGSGRRGPEERSEKRAKAEPSGSGRRGPEAGSEERVEAEVTGSGRSGPDEGSEG